MINLIVLLKKNKNKIVIFTYKRNFKKLSKFCRNYFPYFPHNPARLMNTEIGISNILLRFRIPS